MRLVVVLLEQLVTELDVLGFCVLLAQASVDLLLPLVVLRLALCVVSGCSYSVLPTLHLRGCLVFRQVAIMRAG